MYRSIPYFQEKVLNILGVREEERKEVDLAVTELVKNVREKARRDEGGRIWTIKYT
ncbi:MAG: hypothetical protein QXJ25_03760 [Candidatus Aenigmatarchaeota archaeon]